VEGVPSISEPSELIKRLLASEVKGDLLALFHKNPGLIDNLDGLARRIGRTANSVKADVEDLVSLGVLRTKNIGRSEVIFLDHARDKEVQEIIVNYLKSLKTEKGGQQYLE